MGGTYKERYGIPGDEVKNLADRFFRNIKYNSTWDCLDDFLRWVSESNYRKGLWIRRLDPSKPFSPENAYWHDTKAEKEEKKQKIEADRAIVSPFCVNCDKECRSGWLPGCQEWREYWVKNWNKNICRKPPEEQNTKYFRYEHPDLVREGIGFESRPN